MEELYQEPSEAAFVSVQVAILELIVKHCFLVEVISSRDQLVL
jgi:hypothetical protein